MAYLDEMAYLGDRMSRLQVGKRRHRPLKARTDRGLVKVYKVGEFDDGSRIHRRHDRRGSRGDLGGVGGVDGGGGGRRSRRGLCLCRVQVVGGVCTDDDARVDCCLAALVLLQPLVRWIRSRSTVACSQVQSMTDFRR